MTHKQIDKVYLNIFFPFGADTWKSSFPISNI